MLKEVNRAVALICLFSICLASIVFAETTVGNNNTGPVSGADSTSSTSSTSGGGSASIEEKSYTAPSLAAAQGTDTVQFGSVIFGSISVSKDMRSLELRRNIGTVVALHQAELVDLETVKEFAEYTVQELRKESKENKCFQFIPCGKDRKIWNLFKLI